MNNIHGTIFVPLDRGESHYGQKNSCTLLISYSSTLYLALQQIFR